MHSEVLSIEEAFGDLSDPRSRTPVHGLTEVLLVALCAILSGANNWAGIELWGRAKLNWLRRHVPLKNGIPSHDAFGRVFAALDPEQFEACFVRWMSGLCPALAGQVVAIDGKTIRRSHQRGERAIHRVSAYGSGLGVVLGQVRTAQKSNEITTIPALLDALRLKGAVVTLDAMGCQRHIATKIVAAGAHYVLAVKENQPTLLAHLRQAFDVRGRLPEIFCDITSEHSELEKGHGRIETRRCTALSFENPNFGPECSPGMQSIVRIESTREIGDKVSTEGRYFVSSLPADAQRLAHAVRARWGIENGMHWSLDMAFAEDQCRVWVANAAQNFAILRRIVMNLLRQDTTYKTGLKNRHILACTNDDYLAKLLGWRTAQDG
ncbi:ISAs1 family transposase [Pandoraea sputorum]|uniref:ISAs1 family transposase n=1 Tax=Pandoraea sputorum TaxID=93222 RepID=UPI001242CA05|nr:ISAs1 family transposase [Pandoraea sputorum]VVE54730.1 hypothetical protein PSP20601_04932 [Pandoraea sputorum]